MSFSDTDDASAGIDPSAGGFASIFGSTADVPTDALETDSPDGATAADTDSPEAPDGELSAEELVAARFAAAREEDGIEPDAEDEPEQADLAGADLESLTPDQIRALAAEALTLKGQQSAWQEQQLREGVKARVAQAEAAAIDAVTAQFQQTVLKDSANHYDSILRERIDTITKIARTQDDPDAFIATQSLLAMNTVMKYRREYESEQANAWDARAEQAKDEARGRVPELRALYARDLAQHYGLPEAAIADIAHGSRHIQNFDHRAQELVEIARTLGDERKRTATSKRTAANTALREQPVRTATTGRSTSAKPRDYTGSTAELAAMLPFLRE